MTRKTVSAALVAAALCAFAAHAEIGHPNVCDNYPAGAIEAGHKGRIDLAFTITTEGNVRDPRILNSSGYPELDEAALTCVRAWHYHPAVAEGSPVEAPWRAAVVFGFDALPERPAFRQFVREFRECVRNSPVLERRPAVFFGITDLKFMFSPGRVPEVSILGKSGDDELDAKALECARSSSALSDLAREVNAPSWVWSFTSRVML